MASTLSVRGREVESEVYSGVSIIRTSLNRTTAYPNSSSGGSTSPVPRVPRSRRPRCSFRDSFACYCTRMSIPSNRLSICTKFCHVKPLCNFDSAAGHDSDLDEDVANARMLVVSKLNLTIFLEGSVFSTYRISGIV
ncbi:hypothetical protein EVAR_2241_1 [Eumeta japonica]|uniref:Uncharacterized protein n=1 Tax=Eumeta variegata TaxID=151549 RepID=A0A4C1SIG0_EUMVA|nr:hypothetical protein EVAR_2241_1 [Eumeta japonica]